MIGMVIADDELIIRQGLTSIDWNRYGIMVLGTAENGNEALSIIISKHPQILITDIRMPGMDGLKLIEAAKEQVPEIQSILLTGYEDFNYAKTAISLGAIDYILKPSDPDEIIEAVLKAKSKIDEIIQLRNLGNQCKQRKINNRIVREVLDYIENHYSEDISLFTAAEHVHMNHVYLSRLFKKELGETFLENLTKYRLQKACELLSNSDYKIYEISSMVGIFDPGYFSQVFKKYYGLTPSEYRDKLSASKGV
ncbi:Two component transcriptional regulator, AraC family [Thermoclostridium stercorarium subsp. stercorarium DSM 8532]|uniref:Stage 0 sporulation protein A homolog n=3 Tax=Thermoclostridium stercorarium TaxID=1510 RepID=L7VT29_THES1|nr:response regulator [Thermoclostridium stercorarium]AGC68678.1 Two component transcriptional regulator, AraC family [Thermoclostridium stercorarium subsp. stercorarium DSM 8532]AGI39688.1 response regulator [Thermoclostridium stercorarium subsp. stercorarium DSM 8532]ANW99014.1 AraC family transcriptional regulator [Thermoclostridium stercorarium subsp. thermolacticum DSM 2910]ANX01542.1 AraC family transcriptional regulator [Thermoclostridium stercorarium subsp. leptospartum DSM 9219]UZQ846